MNLIVLSLRLSLTRTLFLSLVHCLSVDVFDSPSTILSPDTAFFCQNIKTRVLLQKYATVQLTWNKEKEIRAKSYTVKKKRGGSQRQIRRTEEETDDR